MTPLTYQLPNGTTPVLLTSDTAGLLHDEAAAVLGYATTHPEVTPQAIAGMLFRTRIARKHRALAMVTDRNGLLGALRAIADGHDHPAVVRTTTPAATRRAACVFPGQGSQRPGMGRLFYESVPSFKAEVDSCAEVFAMQFGESPLNYLLDEDAPAKDNASTVQPALFVQMAGLAAMWRSLGVTPAITIGHSQGEIAAAYVSGLMTLADAARVVGIRARAADEFVAGDYAMAVIAADRDTCEDLLARSSGWAELSVVNSPSMTGISGDRDTVQSMVDSLTERDIFARVIRVQYPAHTSLINGLGEKLRATIRRELQNAKFLETDVDCLGATLGGPITGDLPVDQYWFWNLRNTVRFDKAIATAVGLGVDTFVELADHPTLQLAIQDNLAALNAEAEDRWAAVVGTSNRTATDLDEFTRNLAELAVHDLQYSWDSLGTEFDGPIPLPLIDFPNTRMNETSLWLPYDPALRLPAGGKTPVTSAAAAPRSAPQPGVVTPSARLLTEAWVRLSRRSLVPPRAIGIVDHTGACAELAAALCAAAEQIGATARVVDTENPDTASDFDTQVILLPQSPELDDSAAAAEVAAFFSDRPWWLGVHDGLSDCWLVTAGGEAVVADDSPPDLVHAGASAGFRSVGAKYLGVRFRHLDLPAGFNPSEPASTVLSALHTADESELALRDGGLYVKRIVEADDIVDQDAQAPAPGHVLIVGGTGNLGLKFCEHFARRGARRITLVNRSGETAHVAERLTRIRSSSSAQIDVARCDVSDEAAVSQLARQHADTPADLIIHAAVTYAGIELEDITTEMVDDALRPKVLGIWRVLEAFPRTDDCRVVLCSSISATVGGRGMIVYAASNRMLDAMAQRRRAEGLDCVSVQWGHWDVHPDLDGSAVSKLAGAGVVVMQPADALAVGMSAPLRRNAVVAAFELDRARSVLESCGRGSLLSQLNSAPMPAAIPATDPGVSAPVAQQDVSQRFMALLAHAIGVDAAETIDTEIPMVAIGLDSLQALELRRRVQLEFNHDLEVVDLLGGASISDVLARLSG